MDAICNKCRGTGRTIQQAFNAACATTFHEHCAMILIEAGADVNVPCAEEISPLYVATHSRSYDLLKALINAGADINASSRHVPPPLMSAADSPFNVAEQMVNLLIQAGANVNMTSNIGSTALMNAAWRATSPNVISALINAGADVNARNDQGQCALTQAAVKSFDEGLEIIIEAADRMDPTRSNFPVLSDVEFEIRRLKSSTLKILLRNGLKINVPNQYFNNTLTYYIVECKRKHDRLSKYVCMLLFAAGESVTGPTVEGRTYYRSLVRAEVPEYIFHKNLRLCLKHLCRETIRKHLLKLDPHKHLFGRVPKLGLPTSLTDYLVYEMTLDDETTAWCECSRSHRAALSCRVCQKR